MPSYRVQFVHPAPEPTIVADGFYEEGPFVVFRMDDDDRLVAAFVTRNLRAVVVDDLDAYKPGGDS